MSATLASVLAIGWEPEIRGISVVLIGVVVLCGSVYFILSTNLGSRLGFLVALAGLFGWLMMMGIFWWVYGIGLQGKAPSWSGMEVIGTSLDESAHEVARVDNIADATTEESVDGWIRIAGDDPAFGQTVAAADDPSPDVRAHCVRLLSKLGYHESRYLDQLTGWAGSGPPVLQQAALDALGRLAVNN